MTEQQTILAAIDFSDLSLRVLEYACRLATAWQMPLLIIHVVHDLTYFSGLYRPERALDELQQHMESEARERLEALCQSALRHDVVYEMVVVTGRPLAELYRLIRERSVACVVIGAHSTDKPEHQLFGSTAERLLQQIACPVLLVPARTSSEFISHG